jgi:hypothetical protein
VFSLSSKGIAFARRKHCQWIRWRAHVLGPEAVAELEFLPFERSHTLVLFERRAPAYIRSVSRIFCRINRRGKSHNSVRSGWFLSWLLERGYILKE